MIASLLATILIESLVVLAYAFWRGKPLARLLLAGLLANLLTQSLLWVVLSFFFAHYLQALLISEVFIWLMESLVLRLFPGSRLGWPEAMVLSLGMNLASFTVGWFLPV